MDRVRDLAGAQLWRESLERSRTRRRRALHADEPARPAGAGHTSLPAGRAFKVIAGLGATLMLVLLAALLPGASDGRGDRVATTTGHPKHVAGRSARDVALVVPAEGASGRGAAGVGTAACQAVRRSSGYVNPLAHATVKPKRIDQGVDYTGSGTLTAIGPATITEIAVTDTGWPGAFIEYRLTAGPAAGCFVFYAEGVTPVSGLSVGQAARAGQPIATLIDGYADGIEIGWGAGSGTETLAAQRGEWSSTNDSDSIPTGTGRSFSAMIAALGGPPGKVGG